MHRAATAKTIREARQSIAPYLNATTGNTPVSPRLGRGFTRSEKNNQLAATANQSL